MKALRALVAVVLAAGLVAAVASGAAAARKPVAHHASIEMLPLAQGGPQGVAYLKRVGTKLTGWIVVWGLAPGSTHAWHVHGPNGSCTGTQAAPVASDDDLVADANGVGYLKVSTTATVNVIRRGFYLNVHELGSADGVGPGITCGDIRRST
jgi:hypothetical protein